MSCMSYCLKLRRSVNLYCLDVYGLTQTPRPVNLSCLNVYGLTQTPRPYTSSEVSKYTSFVIFSLRRFLENMVQKITEIKIANMQKVTKLCLLQGSTAGCPPAVQCQIGSGIQVVSLDPSFTNQV